MPAVILRNVLENPGWYTAYTPYQAEISQGRLEALLNFQTMIMELCGLEVAGASLLDEATAAAEAMHMFAGLAERDDAKVFFVSELCHPQTIAVVRTRAAALGIEVVVGDHASFDLRRPRLRRAGAVPDHRRQHPRLPRLLREGARGAAPAWPWPPTCSSLALLVPPGEFGADVALGSVQRFGLPLGYGGPHAAFFATRKEFTRKMPGRLIGVSADAHGAHRLPAGAADPRAAHPPREGDQQHLHLAGAAGGAWPACSPCTTAPSGIRAIATRVAQRAATLAQALASAGLRVATAALFDTVRVDATAPAIAACHARAEAAGICLRQLSPTALTITLDETTTDADVETIVRVHGARPRATPSKLEEAALAIPPALVRTSAYPAAPDLLGLPLGDRDAALPAAPADQGSLAGGFDDSRSARAP